MKAKSLANSNPFLASDAKAKSKVITCVASSTAIETGEEVKVVAKRIAQRRSAKRPVLESS